MQELYNCDFVSKSVCCEQFVTFVKKHPDVIHYLITSGEAHFELSSCVKLILSSCIWNHFSQRVTARCGVSALGVIGTYFFEDHTDNEVPLTSDWHVHMVNEFLFTELYCHDTDVATVWYQQDKAMAHPAWELNTLMTLFQHHILSHHSEIPWPAHSLSLFEDDFLLWDYLKRTVSNISSRLPQSQIQNFWRNTRVTP